MIANLAGSLALVTCKEPLRVSISNHLRSLLLRVTQDQSLVEQIVQVCANDNLELGCMLIEKASTEKAVRDIDEELAASYQARRKCRETNQPFVDLVSSKPGMFIHGQEQYKNKTICSFIDKNNTRTKKYRQSY